MGLKRELDKLYLEYNHRKFVHPDPLEFLYNYNNIEDREIVGLVASALAYGRVIQILKSVSLVLSKMIPYPSVFIRKSSPDLICNSFKDFKHRFTTGGELCCLLTGIKNTLEKYGSLNNCFLEGLRIKGKTWKKTGEIDQEGSREETILPAALYFLKNLNTFAGIKCNSLMPSPTGGSAFKRLNLYLRWMVRKDNVDPGGWTGIPASRLIIPLDTHIYRISVKLGFTRRKQADIKTAIEITNTLKEFDKNDPVKYDFVLTRLGMNRIEEVLLKKII